VDLVVVAGLAVAYSGLRASYRLADEVPEGGHAVAASGRLDAEISGSNPIQVLVTLPPGLSLYAPETLAIIEDVQRVLESQPGVGNVWSLESLRHWLSAQMGLKGTDALKQYVDEFPLFLVRRFIAKDQRSAVVFGLVPDQNLKRLVPIIDQLKARLNVVRKANPGYGIAVTGLAVIAALSSADMIEKLNRALTIEFVFVAAFIGLAFRSARIGLACLPSGVFPILAAGSLLRLLGHGLQFAGVIALFVSFGLGLSATIHFLNRMIQAREADQDPGIAVAQATVLMGPALILTTLVLTFGLAALVFSSLPLVRLFGWLGAFAMFAALVADLLILRPVITFLLRLGPGGGRLRKVST
jgi:predicted RND superfamily exporter protein